jgi:HEPN domain-containing protein
MTISGAPLHIKRKWYSLALRHLRIASRLLGAGFADGAYFHVYHAYECGVSAFIAAHGVPVPPEGRRG